MPGSVCRYFGRAGPLELRPQLRDVNAQLLGLIEMVGPPHFIQQLPLRENLAGILDQHLQQAVFVRREMDFVEHSTATEPATTGPRLPPAGTGPNFAEQMVFCMEAHLVSREPSRCSTSR
jgi:hypothetical protein